MSALNKTDWYMFEYTFDKSEQNYSPIHKLSYLDDEINVVQNNISAMEDRWVYNLANRWEGIYQEYEVPRNYTVTIESGVSEYPSFLFQRYSNVVAGDVRAAAQGVISNILYFVERQESIQPQVAEYVVYDNVRVSTELTPVARIVDDIYSTIVRHISISWQKIALLRVFLRAAVCLKSNLLTKLSTLKEFVSIVVTQATWFVCHGFHPPAEFAKGN